MQFPLTATRRAARAVSLAAPLFVAAATASASFDTFNLGTIDQQQGWTTRDGFQTSVTVGNWDQAVVQVGAKRVWRISNAVTSGTYASQTFSSTSAEVAGETGSALWNDRGTNGSAPTAPQFGAFATNNQFYSRVDFRSATGAAQNGLAITLSASAKQSSVRMSWLQIADTGSGFDLRVYNTGLNGTFPSSSTTIASGLSYTDLHSIETTIDFVDGVTNTGSGIMSNDVLKVYLNGSLVHTGSTWESYYYLNELTTPGQPRLQAVDSMLFRVAGTAAPGTLGNGFYFENVVVGNVPAPGVLALLGAAGLVGSRRRR